MPAEKLADILQLVRGLMAENVVPTKQVRTLAGKCTHIASLILVRKPFLDHLWAAIASGGGNAPKNCVWQKQILDSLVWLEAFLSLQKGSIRRVFSYEAYFGMSEAIEVTTDAWPFGIGGWLTINGQVVAYFLDKVTDQDVQILGRERGTCEGQQVWESLAVLVALRLWRSHWAARRMSLRLRSDNVGALTRFAVLRGKSPALSLIAREFALDLGDMTYMPDVIAHLPGVANVTADTLSRRFDPSKESTWQLPPLLAHATQHSVPERNRHWWHTLSG